jgi:DNA-binding Xre family transcriptional regulator
MNIWNKKYNKTNKSVYEISKELNIPEEKIKEVIRGERQVPANDVDRVNGAFVSNSIGITSFERAMMEQFFFDNDIQDLKKKFGYKTLRELSSAMGIGVATMYYFRGDKIKAISDKLLKKAYDFFQNDWNKKVNSKQKAKRENGKVWYYQMPFEDLPKEVVEWYNTVDLKDLLYKEGIKVPELMKKIGFTENYAAIYYKYAKGTVNGCTSNWLLVQQLYNYYHGLELLNTRARHADELYGNINTPTFEYNDIECLDVEPVATQNETQEHNEENNEMEVVEPIEKGTAMYIEYEEYKKVCEELERYKFLIDMLIKQER